MPLPSIPTSDTDVMRCVALRINVTQRTHRKNIADVALNFMQGPGASCVACIALRALRKSFNPTHATPGPDLAGGGLGPSSLGITKW